MTISKKSDDGALLEFVKSLSFFGIMANLEQFGSPSPDVWSVKLTFSLTVTQ